MSNNYRYYYVYILKCEDASYFTGVSNDVEERLFEHNVGINPKCYTYLRRPVKVVYTKAFEILQEAIDYGRQLKLLSTREMKAFVNGDFNHEEFQGLNQHGGYYSDLF